MAFKMKGMPGIAGVETEQNKIKELNDLKDRWEGTSIKDFNRDLDQARLDFINSEPKPTPEEIKQFDKTHAENREKATGGSHAKKRATHTMPDGTVMPGAKHGE